MLHLAPSNGMSEGNDPANRRSICSIHGSPHMLQPGNSSRQQTHRPCFSHEAAANRARTESRSVGQPHSSPCETLSRVYDKDIQAVWDGLSMSHNLGSPPADPRQSFGKCLRMYLVHLRFRGLVAVSRGGTLRHCQGIDRFRPDAALELGRNRHHVPRAPWRAPGGPEWLGERRALA